MQMNDARYHYLCRRKRMCYCYVDYFHSHRLCEFGGYGYRLLLCFFLLIFSIKQFLLFYPDDAGWLVSDGQHRLMDNDDNGSVSKPTGKLVLRLWLDKLFGNSICPSTNGYIGCKYEWNNIRTTFVPTNDCIWCVEMNLPNVDRMRRRQLLPLL